ncbi:MAG: arginase family protein, partial [Thermoproteota archaeon]
RYLGERAAKLGVHVVPAWRIAREGVEAAGEAVEHLLESGAEEYYISVDVDHVAEAWAPGVNAPSPLGLDPRESAAILLEASRRLRPRGIDVVEVSPPYDVGDATSRLAAALLLYAIYGALRG